MGFVTKCLLVCLSLGVTAGAKLPAELSKCMFEEDECFRNAANFVVKNYYKGLPSMGLLPLDPIEVKEVSILEDKNANKNKAISLNLWFKDWKVHGIRNMNITSLSGFKKEGAKKLILTAEVPQLQLIGNYKINGQVLVLPIQGEGYSNLTLDNCKLQVTTKGEFVERKGRQYLELFGRPKIDLQTSQLYIRLDNLFNGNKALGDTMNRFLNENWKELYAELKDGILDALGISLTNLINNIFLRIPYEQLFNASEKSSE